MSILCLFVRLFSVLPLLGFFSVFASAGLFSVSASVGLLCILFVMLSVGWLCLQSCSLAVCVAPRAFLECCVCWVPWVCLFLKVGYAGGTVGQSLAIGQPPEGYAVYWAIGYVPGHPQGETSLRIWVWIQKILLNTWFLHHFQGITEVEDVSFQCGHIIYTNNIGPLPCQ